MSPDSRELFAHLARALSRYIPEATREARAMGLGVPGELLTLAEFFTDCARTRQDATSGAGPGRAVEAMAMTDTLLLTKRQAAAELACSVRGLERLVAGGAVRTVQVGGAVRIRRADLEAYVAGLHPKPSSFLDDTVRKDTA